MILQDLHIHSKYDDGRGSLMEIAEAAKDRGLCSVGFSGHSPLPYENDWSMSWDSFHAYMEEGRKVKESMGGELDVYLGIEYDVISDLELSGFDYVIGSVHHVMDGEEPVSIDDTLELFEEACTRFGNVEKLVEAYYETVGQLADNPYVDIVGHFDIITKFNERKCLIDTDGEAYVAASKSAMKKLVKAGKIFEINSGAVSRGYRTEPYPSKALLCELHKMGGRVTITSDAHSLDGLCYGFEQAKVLAGECGFGEIWQLIDGKFQAVEL